MKEELFEQLDFTVNQQYEQIIDDLLEKQYSIVDDFFDPLEILKLRSSLLHKYEEDKFKKSAIGNRTNELIEKAIRGDFILWMNEAEAGETEKIFFIKSIILSNI